MKQKMTVVFMLCVAVLFSACTNDKTEENDTPDATGQEEVEQRQDQDNDVDQIADSGAITTITAYANSWNDLYGENEEAVNNYEGMPIIELVTPALAFITGVQYDLLNMDNQDGRHEGTLMLAGYAGYVDRDGDKLTFGYEETLAEDGFDATAKIGDRLVEEGSLDFETGYYVSDAYTERGDAIIDRTLSQFLRLEDGSMLNLTMIGKSMDWQGEADPSNTVIFIHNGEDRYDFVVGTGTIGPDFEAMELQDDMTKAEALELFADAGFTITSSGGIDGDVMKLD
ncbi:MAG TPA: hypothetical protein PKL83_00500 [bacterium]|nr:hypothetical protein [bacterium]